MKFLFYSFSLLSVFANLSSDDLEKAEVFEFESQVNQVMDIIIHSLYKTKDVFLRELISNGADALDKIRLASLTDPSILGDNQDLKINISVDEDEKKLIIRDYGIGMTKDQLQNNLGTIAKSGTADFLKAMKDKDLTDPGLIGKFGVGFYSAFLVSDSIMVTSKHNDDEQYIWESSSQNGYRILKDPRGDTLGRGTEITLTIKDDAAEFLKTDKLKEIIKRHSEFVNFPIYLWVGESVEDKIEYPDDDSDEEVVVEDVNDTPTQPKFKTVFDWKLINENKPIWKRDPKDLTPEDYEEFAKKHFGDYQKPLAYSHFKLEGDAEFTCLVFVPRRAPAGFLKPEATQNSFVELYVKKVLIAENLRDLLPQWLNFLKIVIDSDDLPLNVSRETVQNHASIKQIKKKLISKSLDLFEEIAKRDNDDYSKFFREYGKGLKYGLYESRSSHEKKLLELMRFPTTADKFSSFEAYVGRMKEGQPQIYYSASENSPYADAVTDKGYEIILMLEPMDEYLAKDRIKKYKDIPVQDIDKSGVKLGEDDVSEESMKSLEEKFEPLTTFLFKKLSDKVSKVLLNTKLSKTAGAVVPGPQGISPYQEKIVKIQNAGKELDYSASFYLKQKKIFEINPNHPLIIRMLQLVEEEDFDSLKSISIILYGNSAIGSGWDIEKPKELSIRIEKLLRKYLGAAEGMEDDDVEPEHVEEPKPLIADTEDNLIKSYIPSDDEDHLEL